ncbi:MAG: NUDIX domain-containing protein [Candidatus Shapirobacteria bacterium]|jgi:ADP-ribose pyrophosphatase YjhB (NUDIX family)
MEDQITIIKDNLYYDERSAGGLVYKIENGKTLWLLIKTISGAKKNGQKAIHKFPKGHLQRDEFLKQAALREVEEEGQVKAKIVSKIGSNNYIIWDKLRKKKIIKKVTFFLMEYAGQSNLKHYDTEMVLDREWLQYDDACEKLAYDSEKVLLKRARIKLEELQKKSR